MECVTALEPDLVKGSDLEEMIKAPTVIMIALRGSFLVTKAPRGAAITPPINKPRITFQWVRPMVKMKTTDSVSVTKNSEN